MSAGTAAMDLLRPLLASLLLACAAAGWAADATKAVKAPKPQGPAWASLTADQQQILAPLRAHWDDLDTTRKKKWIGVAARYPKMSPTEQQRVQRRMEAWAKLSPEERRVARENYRDIAKLPPDKKQDLREKWAEYQSLSPAERSRLDVRPVEPPAERKRRARPGADPATSPSPQTRPHVP